MTDSEPSHEDRQNGRRGGGRAAEDQAELAEPRDLEDQGTETGGEQEPGDRRGSRAVAARRHGTGHHRTPDRDARQATARRPSTSAPKVLVGGRSSERRGAGSSRVLLDSRAESQREPRARSERGHTDATRISPARRVSDRSGTRRPRWVLVGQVPKGRPKLARRFIAGCPDRPPRFRSPARDERNASRFGFCRGRNVPSLCYPSTFATPTSTVPRGSITQRTQLRSSFRGSPERSSGIRGRMIDRGGDRRSELAQATVPPHRDGTEASPRTAEQRGKIVCSRCDRGRSHYDETVRPGSVALGQNGATGGGRTTTKRCDRGRSLYDEAGSAVSSCWDRASPCRGRPNRSRSCSSGRTVIRSRR